ncbi:MAG: hypothetical protein ACFFDS_02630 [Candidatus Thorarchaeota archaeon]
MTILVVTLFLSVTLTSVKTLGYDWNSMTTMGLVEHDNTEYGYLSGNHMMENQYLETNYATDIRYVSEGVGNKVDSMNNNSKEFRTSLTSMYYDSYDTYDYYSNAWSNHITYIQAMNNTGLSPQLNFTVGLNDKGALSLKSQTALEMEAGVFYLFTVNLRAGEVYDLNMRATNFVSYFVFYGEYYSFDGSVGAVPTRDVQFLFARESGEHQIYFYSSNENYIIIEPRELKVKNLSVDSPQSGTFINQPNQIWNETIHATQENKKKEAVHAFFLTIPKGDYKFKYIRFDTYDTDAWILTSSMYYEETSQPGYLEFPIGSTFTEKFTFHFEYDTKIVILITAERDNTDYIEFDYIFSVTSEDFPILESGEQYQYQDDLINFGINIEETQIAYLNWSEIGTEDVYMFKYVDEQPMYSCPYTLRTYAEDATKLLLHPGYYYFMNPTIASYDFLLEFNIVNYVEFNSTMNINLEQENGEPINYKLLKLDVSQFAFDNYNFSFLMPNNYTLEVSCDTYLENYPYYALENDFVLGNQEVNGEFFGYNQNESQELSFLGFNLGEVRYVLLYIEELYNNTGYSWSNYGDPFVNQTSAVIRMEKDPGYPDDFNNINVHMLNAFPETNGNWSATYNFNDVENDEELYFINATVPEYTWYKIRVYIVNGTRDSSYHLLETADGMNTALQPFIFHYVYRDAVWNRYYYKDAFYPNYFVTIDSTYAPDNYTYEIEFGVLDPTLVFIFAVNHVGLNGSISIEFIPYSCSGILGIYDLGLKGGLSTGAIVALAIIGGAIVAGTIAFVIVRVVLPKRKTPY